MRNFEFYIQLLDGRNLAITGVFVFVVCVFVLFHFTLCLMMMMMMIIHCFRYIWANSGYGSCTLSDVKKNRYVEVFVGWEFVFFKMG